MNLLQPANLAQMSSCRGEQRTADHEREHEQEP
jgi:hypothetical protein